MECNRSFHDYIIQCPEGINVNLVADSGPYAALEWQITDKFDNQYTGTVVTNGNGGFIIPVEDLPAGLLTAYSGDFELKVLDTDRDNRPVPILVAGYYDSIQFSIGKGNRIKDNLGEVVDCSGVSTAAGASQEFTGDGTTTTFTVTGLPTPGQEEVHVGGLLYDAPTHYTLDGHDLIFVDPPTDGVEIRIDY